MCSQVSSETDFWKIKTPKRHSEIIWPLHHPCIDIEAVPMWQQQVCGYDSTSAPEDRKSFTDTDVFEKHHEWEDIWMVAAGQWLVP